MSVGALFVDLDHFKMINDTLGHDIGDQLLGRAAKRLVSCVREGDTVARLGGDEFLIILPNLYKPTHPEVVARKILEAFSKPFELQSKEIFSTTSIGISIYPDDSDNPKMLLQNSDAAMYQAKRLGRNDYQFYTPELNLQAREHMETERQMRHALERDEFTLCYQPLIDAESREIYGAEALLRWHNPELGQVPPDKFIPIAENTGLIVDIGQWVLRTACQQMHNWHEQGLEALRISVNVSSRQLRETGFPDLVSRILKDSGAAANQLVLEITESILIEDIPETSMMLDRLNSKGIQLSLDDFGTGYSALSYLKRYPFRLLKIDRTFVRDIIDSEENISLVRAIIAMAHALHLKVIAEGVESREQLEFMCGEKCDLIQGYYFSEPLLADEFLIWVKEKRPDIEVASPLSRVAK